VAPGGTPLFLRRAAVPTVPYRPLVSTQELVLLAASLVGSLLAGALIAARFRLPTRLAAMVTAFGGGILMSSVALELVPDADEGAGIRLTAIGIAVGALIFVGADALLSRAETPRLVRRSRHAAAAGQPMPMPLPMLRSDEARGKSIAVGIFVDGVPESLALGLTSAQGALGRALLVGVLVGNVVEAYGSAQPIVMSGLSRAFAIVLLGGIGVALGVAVLLGGTVFAEASPEFIGVAEAIAAGSVLAVVSISVIPYAFEEVDQLVALAVVAGFILGYLLR
jgi:zinc transporter, ZIP family